MMINNPGYRFSIELTYYEKSHGFPEISSLNINNTLTDQTSDDIGLKLYLR
jgi:hypothetical protein